MRKIKAVAVGILTMALCVNMGAAETMAKESGVNIVSKGTIIQEEITHPSMKKADERETVTDSQGLVYRYPIDDEGEITSTEIWSVSAGELKKSNIIVPDTFHGKKVAQVDWDGFKDCKKLRSITLGKNVNCIKSMAFLRCKNLSEVKIKGNSLESIYSSAFDGCISLKKIDLPKSMKWISESAFARSGLEQITVPAKVINLYGYSFAECKKLKKVKLSKNLYGIQYSCFEGCTALEEIVIPKKVKNIRYEAFKGCKKLENVTFRGKVEEIEKNAFQDTPFLNKAKKGKYCIINGLLVETYHKVKGNLAINGKKKINGQKIRGISGSAYSNNKNLNKITIKNVKLITGYAFENCKAKECRIKNAGKFSYWAFYDSEIPTFRVQSVDELNYCFGGLKTKKYYAEDIGKYGYRGIPEDIKEVYLDFDKVYKKVRESLIDTETLYVPAHQLEEYKSFVRCNVEVWEK